MTIELAREPSGQLRVWVNGRALSPARSQRVWNHSPTGFEVGYGGSGPAQLALALLLEAGLSDERAVHLHQRFKWDFLAVRRAPCRWVLDVRAWAHGVDPEV